MLSIGEGFYGEHFIYRWSPGAGVSVVAGTGVEGYDGDGGPAREALLDLTPPPGVVLGLTGIVARPDGGFVFTDTGNGAVRAVDANGIIRTIAGGPAGPFRTPLGLAATPDGSHLVTDWGRLRRVGPDGTIKTVARVDVEGDVVVTAHGTAVIGEPERGELWRLEPGSRTLRPYLRPERPTDTFDFAARETFGQGLALDPHGGLLAVGPLDRYEDSASVGLTYVPNGPTPWTLAALRDARTSRRAVTAVIESTQPGTATLELVRRGRIVARVMRPVAAGHSTLRAVGPIRDAWYDLRLVLESAHGTTARDEVPVHGARALTVPRARRLLGRYQGNLDGVVRYRLGEDCRRFGRRRVDCEIRSGSEDCKAVASVTLGRSGVVLRRHYRCRRPRFQRHPRFIAPFGVGVQRLSRFGGGLWAEG